MRNLILFMHTSFDGFVAGPKGELDWVQIDDEIIEHVHTRVDETDMAMYGRVTYEMMEGYWPTAADQPNASDHDKHHGAWYNKISKVVLSKTLKTNKPGTQIIGRDLVSEVTKLKQQPGPEILVFGSPSAGQALMAENLIDGYWLFINPVLLGSGIPLFRNPGSRQKLKLLGSRVFKSGVVCLDYTHAAA